MKSQQEQAECLLAAVQKKLWVPDPLAVEWMAEVHNFACDANTKDEVCILAADCDEWAALLASSFLAVGLNAAIVGHAYDMQRRIQHVLCLVRVNGKWKYADPSTQLPLGECVKYSRERVLSVPSVKVICDSDVCIRDGREYDPDEHGFVDRGEFVGVAGVPGHSIVKFAWLHDVGTVAGHPTSEKRQKFQWLGQEDNPYEKCLDQVSKGDLDTGAGREAAAKQGGRCAADAVCAVYSSGAIPAGVCSTVVGPVVDEVVDFFSDLFGGSSGIDCGKLSTFDPCHICKYNFFDTQSGGSVFGGKSYEEWRRTDPACKAWLAAAPARLRGSAESAAGEAFVKKYTDTWRWALSAEAKRPYEELQQDPPAFAAAEATLVSRGARLLTAQEIENGARGTDTAAVARVHQATQSVEQASAGAGTSGGRKKKSSALPAILGIGALAGGAWWLSRG